MHTERKAGGLRIPPYTEGRKMNLREYIALFNAEDKEYCPTDIDNAECEE